MAEAVRVFHEPHRTSLRGSETVFLVVVALATWAGREFGEGGATSPWFGPSGFGIPIHYLLFGFLLVVVSPYVLRAPRFPLSERLHQLGILYPSLTAAAVLAFSLAVAILRGVPELFADWRNLAVTAVTAIYAAKWLADQDWRRYVLTDLATLYGLLSLPHLVGFVFGTGSEVLGVRTPVDEGTTLYLASFAAFVAAWNVLRGDANLGAVRTFLVRMAGISGSLLVLLGFRRSFWLALGTGLVVLALLHLRSRNIASARLIWGGIGGVILLVVMVAALGSETVIARIQSMIPTSSGDYTATNEDHINDLIDAWAIIEQDPVLGFGIGRHYETELIADWKSESFEVHNAVLHVWLKFGIAGAFTYLWFHLRLARAAAIRRMAPVAAFIVGQLVATIFGTWPYGRFQMAIFLGLLIAILAVETNHHPASAESV